MTWKTAHGFTPAGKPATVDIHVQPVQRLVLSSSRAHPYCYCGRPTEEFGIDRVCRTCRVVYQRGT